MGGQHPNSLAATARGPDRLLGWLILVAALLLMLGWTLPIMTVNKLWFLSERVSILKGALELWRHGDALLIIAGLGTRALFHGNGAEIPAASCC